MIARHVFRQGLIVGREDFRAFWNWRTWLSAWMLRIGTSAAIWVLLGRMLESPEQAEFLLVGNAVMAGPTAVGMVIPASTWNRADGTYPLLVVAPSSMVPAMLGRTGIWWLHGVGTALATFALLAGVFGVSFRAAALVWLLGPVALVCASAYCFCLALGSVVNRAPSLRNVLQNGVMPLLMAVCGVSVPLGFWPTWVQVIAHGLPVTHGLSAIRALLAGGETAGILRSLGLEALVGACWLGFAILAMDRLADAGRADGSIELI